MSSMARLVFAAVLGLYAASSAAAQITIQPTAAPTVTAETESWYLMNEPVFFAGNAYYPTGPAMHFLPNEMVLSGLFRGIPLYTRTTIEPYSLVFLPIGGGMVRPYERRRAGDLAGTTGSSVPSFPVEIPMASSRSTPLQAAGPPFVETGGDRRRVPTFRPDSTESSSRNRHVDDGKRTARDRPFERVRRRNRRPPAFDECGESANCPPGRRDLCRIQQSALV